MQNKYKLQDVLRKRNKDYQLQENRARSRMGQQRHLPPQGILTPERLVELRLLKKRAQKNLKRRSRKFLKTQVQIGRLLLVVRVRGVNQTSDIHREIFNRLGLPSVFSARFYRATPELMDNLINVQNYVKYGYPSRKTVDLLVFKRLKVKQGGRTVDLTSNKLVEDHLSELGLICLQDVVQYILQEPDLGKLSQWLEVFSLEGKLSRKWQKSQWGFCGEQIDEFVEKML